MILKRTLKYPVLIVGLVLFWLFITDPATKKYFSQFNNRAPSTCRVVQDRVAPKMPSNWNLECLNTKELVVTIKSELMPKEPKLLRSLLYKQLANSLQEFARYTNLETLEFLKIVRVNLKHENLDINAKTDGEALVQLLAKKDQSAVANHLKLTVRTKEIKK